MRDTILKLMIQLRHDDRGVTLVEYGIALALAVAVGTGALAALGVSVNGNMTAASGAMVIP